MLIPISHPFLIFIKIKRDKKASKKIKNIELQNYNFRVKWIKKCIFKNLEKYFKY